MGGVFMRKLWKRVVFVAVVVAMFWTGTLLADRQRLNQELIRLHVVANSDAAEDQQIKLRVRDAIVESLRQGMVEVLDVEQAKDYLRQQLPQLETLANRVLREAGFSETAVVSLNTEAFPTRDYDTFSLPAGVYEALRVTIGEGEGRNWWCVVFPEFCVPATAEGVEHVAVSNGFPDTLGETLTGSDGYQVRFFLLDCLGKLENLFRRT